MMRAIMSFRISRQNNEEGAIAIITALLLVILILFAALIVDLGRLRVDRSADQLVADFGATAAIQQLGVDGDGPDAACIDAFIYALKNLPLGDDYAAALASGEAGCIDEFGGSYVCPTTGGPESNIEITVNVREYEVIVTYPVHATSPLLSGQDFDEAFDGSNQCDRLGVTVTRAHDYALAPVGGFAGGSTTVSAVALNRNELESKKVASLIVLDPAGCNTLAVSSNNGRLIVGTDPYLNGQPGIILVDSSGTGCGGGTTKNDFVTRVDGGSLICAGVSNLEAVLNDGASCDSAEDTFFSRSVEINKAVRPVDDDQISPEVKYGDLQGREIIDHKYNCRQTGYPIYPAAGSTIWHPHFGLNKTCPTPVTGVGTKDHIDQIQGFFATPTYGPAQWQALTGAGTWQTVSGAACTVGNSTAVYPTVPGRNVYFDCPGTVSVGPGGTLTVNPGKYMIVRGGVDIAGTLIVNPDSVPVGTDADGRLAYGPLAKDVVMLVNGSYNQASYATALGGGASSNILLYRTAALLRSGTLRAQNNLTLIAPVDRAYFDDREQPNFGQYDNCTRTDVVAVATPFSVPSPECFEDLALWSNFRRQHLVTSGGALSLEGIFFTPNSGLDGDAFNMAGNANQELTGAQFFSYRFALTGSAKIGMEPDSQRNESNEVSFNGLIR